MRKITLGNYKSVLNDVTKSMNTQSENLQGLLDLGFEQVLRVDKDGNLNGNLSVLSDIVNACGSMRTKLTKTVTGYIQDHIQHIVWDKDSKKYKKVVDKKVKIAGEYPTYPFWEDKNNIAQGKVATYDENKRFDSFMNQRNKAIASGTIKGDDAKLLEQMKKAIASLESQLAENTKTVKVTAPSYNPEEELKKAS